MPRVRTKGGTVIRTVILSDPGAGSLAPSFVSRTDATFGPLLGLDFPFPERAACVDRPIEISGESESELVAHQKV